MHCIIQGPCVHKIPPPCLFFCARLQVLATHKHPTIMERGLDVCCQLAQCGSAEQQALMDGGVFKTIKQAHQHFPGHTALMEGCCAALTHILSANDAVRAGAMDTGILGLLLALTTQPKVTQATMESACLALASLCGDQTRARIATSGGVPTLLGLLQTHKAAPGMLAPVCGSLQQLITSHGDNQTMVVLHGAQLLLQLMQAHMRDRELQGKALNVMLHLASLEPNAAKLGEAGAVTTLAALCEANSDASGLDVLQLCLVVLVQVSKCLGSARIEG